jgi:cold shock CspA family protein/ribosome-associated translation inhibitor RaiA
MGNETMQLPLQITFKDMAPSPAIESQVREKSAKLERFFDRIIGCHVTIESPHRHGQKGRLYGVRIDLTVPGREIVVTHSGPQDHRHEDIRIAVGDAFRAAARQLEDHARKVGGAVKLHAVPLHGRVTKLMPEYGFVTVSDRQEIYFHRNSVSADGFDHLQVGSEVRLAVAEGESVNGPQATTVIPVGKHHLVG